VSEAHARNSDPETSHQAAASIDKLRVRQDEVLQVIRVFGPMTDTELVKVHAELADDLYQPQSPSGIRTRRSELVTRRLVRDSGARERLASGRMAIVWEAAP
jgi:hypothetical protein